MIIWPYDASRDGLPNSVRDTGAWVMFDRTPYAYLHICGTPWAGNEYRADRVPAWTMRYGAPTEPQTGRHPRILAEMKHDPGDRTTRTA